MKNREYIEQLAHYLRRHIEQCKAWKDSTQKRLAHLERVVLNSVDAPTQTIRPDRYTGERLGPSNAEKCKKVDEAMEWFTNPPSLTPKPEYDPADVAFNRAKPWEWQVPTAAPVDELAALRAENARLVAERDALRARIEAGTVVWGENFQGLSNFADFVKPCDTHTARLIDIAPISDAGKMVDERKGKADRREECIHPRSGSNPRYGKKPIRSVDTARWVATIEHARSNDRRNITGTRKDRKA